ncbi:PAS domain-containing protein [Sneathiella chinensis]|uniref:PAS domain-containing protein n=1 Tax=Sneathiella chinensis TaxID=349750 RepID=A0ABQ5U6D6_9PROT|nr:PAS domain-containing protein [Sneathiella chinensis]GLQ07484.1 hypothetical protein GCM10007924_27050 [Sneathiella chinensis]
MLHGDGFEHTTPIVKAGFDYWLSKTGGRSMPRWADINPAEMLPLLPHILVVHVQYDPLDFIERITGERIVERSACKTMNVNWRNCPEREPGSRMWTAFEEVVNRQEPSYQILAYSGPKKDYLKIEAIICPISDDGKTVIKTIAFVDHVDKADKDRFPNPPRDPDPDQGSA